jgi:hypothetical protein
MAGAECAICERHSKQAEKGFSFERRVEFCFDKVHTLAKFVEFVAAHFAEVNSHHRGVR